MRQIAEVPSLSVVAWIETTLAPVDLETHLAFCAIPEGPQRVKGATEERNGLNEFGLNNS